MIKRHRYIIVIFFLLPCLAFARGYQLRYSFSGFYGPALDNADKRFSMLVKNLPRPLTSQIINDFYTQGPKNIRKAIAPFGYFKPEITGQLEQHGNAWIAAYQIKPGPLLKITHLDVKITGPGRNLPGFRRLLRHFPVRQGQVLLTENYKKAKADLFNIAQKHGFLDATLTKHVIKINIKDYTADVILHFDTGHRYYFGPILFAKTPYAESLLRRYIPFKPGAPYSTDDLLTLQNNLSQSIYFNNVSVKPNQKRARNYHVPVKVYLQPKKSQQYSLGAGYGTDTGIRGSAGWEWRRVTSTGDYLQAIAQVSQIQNAFQLRYIIPGRNPVTDHYSIFAGLNTNQPGEGEYTLLSAGGNYVQALLGFIQTITLSYQKERFKLAPFAPRYNTQYFIPSINWQRTQTNNKINTDNGYRVFLNVEGGQSLQDSNQFLQAELQAKYIHTILDNTRIIARTELGATTVKRLTTLPLSVRFFAGGANSVRGYTYQVLGPGKYLIVGSIELQQRVYKQFYAAVFFDAGNAFNTGPWKMNRSAGIGIVWRSPLGPMELTVARPFDNDPSPKFIKSLRVQFTMGPDL